MLIYINTHKMLQSSTCAGKNTNNIRLNSGKWNGMINEKFDPPAESFLITSRPGRQISTHIDKRHRAHQKKIKL